MQYFSLGLIFVISKKLFCNLIAFRLKVAGKVFLVTSAAYRVVALVLEQN